MEKLHFNYVIGLVIIAVIWIVGFWVVSKVEENQRDELKNKFLQTQRTYQKNQKLRYDRLVESAYLLAENSTFKANLELEDPASVKYSVTEFSRFMKIDMFLVAGKNGNILADIGSDLSEGKNSSVPAIIREALRGKEPDISISWPSIKMINDQLYHIVSVPVYAGRNTIIGALMLGLKFTQLEVNEIKEENLFDVSFFHENKLVASSTDKADRKKLSVDFFKKHFESKTIEMGSTHCFTIIEESINSESLIAFISPMGKGERAYYMCFLSEETAINVANNLANYMYLLNSLLTIGIGFICFNKTSLDFFIKKQSKNDI